MRPSANHQPAGISRPGIRTASKARGGALLGWLVFAYTTFVIYGSLVPLKFTPRPLADAWAFFREIPYLDLGIGSRADWVANILLFVPLAFLWLAALTRNAGPIRKAMVSCLVLLACFALSVAIEFTQIFFPPRTVSLNDIIAESIGAILGTIVWWRVGVRFSRWLLAWYEDHTPTGTAQRLFYAYLFLLFGYSVLPLDLTISVVEIYHKWQEGKILLVPFSAHYDTQAQRVYALLADIAIWIPAAFLWRISWGVTPRRLMLYVLGCATLIEVLQLFVYSRVTSTTDVLTAGCGGAIGIALARWMAPASQDKDPPRPGRFGGRGLLLWVVALAGWAGVITVVFWYPFDFNTEWGFVHQRLATVKRVPFEAYYFGTEFRAVTEVFHKTGFFFPLGAILAVGAAGLRRRIAVPFLLLDAVSMLILSGAAAGIEIGQLFLPDKVADATDWFLESAGGITGYFIVRAFMASSRREADTRRPPSDRRATPADRQFS